jgi:hypothetical protein
METMKTLLGRFACAVALVATTGVAAQNSAYAGPSAIAVTLEGSGTISPGLTADMQNQSGSFSGTVGLVGVSGAGATANLGSCNITFTSDLPEFLALGIGQASGHCEGHGLLGSDTVTCVGMSYIRVGPWVFIRVLLSGCNTLSNGVLGSNSAVPLVAETMALVVPTSGNGVTMPITNYDLVAAGAFVGS